MRLKMYGSVFLSALFIQTITVMSELQFFHVNSYIQLTPPDNSQNSEFGFSLSYQKSNGAGNILVGSPRQSDTGKVHSCSLDGDLNRKVCQELNITANYTVPVTPNENVIDGSSFRTHMLGATVNAISDYIMSCAPLRTALVKENTGETKIKPFGTCYIHNGIDTYSIQGPAEQYFAGITDGYESVIGAPGWSALADESNQLVLVGKTMSSSDIIYMDMNTPNLTRSFLIGESTTDSTFFEDIYNGGYALASGNFLSKTNVSYAFSMQDKINYYGVAFLNYDGEKLSVVRNAEDVFLIRDSRFGSRFGAALHGADVDQDGFTDLLVGAPTQDIGDLTYDRGAFHIIRNLETQNSSLLSILVIKGHKDGSHFGSAITTNDLDEDLRPEIFVSAPFEDEGAGAVYIISAHDVNMQFDEMQKEKKTLREISLRDLVNIQRIAVQQFTQFGFSILTFPKINRNKYGLAVGSPASSRVLLFRSLPAVTVNVHVKLQGRDYVREQDQNFTVRVCVDIENSQHKNVKTRLLVTNYINGNKVSISSNERIEIFINDTVCENVEVTIGNLEPGEYTFTSKVHTDDELVKNEKAYKDDWVFLTPRSSTERQLTIHRRCKAEDCDPDLSVIYPNITHYTLGSSSDLIVNITIRNRGHSTYEGCARVRVSGASVSYIDCESSNETYTCYLPKPLNRNVMFPLNIKLNMSRMTSDVEGLHIQVDLYNNCVKERVTSSELHILYELNPHAVHLNRTPQVEQKVKSDKKETLIDIHEYVISNNGTVTWKNLTAVLTLKKAAYITDVDILNQGIECLKNELEDVMKFHCKMDLAPTASVKVIATAALSKSESLKLLKESTILHTETSFTLFVTNTFVLNETLTNGFKYVAEKSFGQNKPVIILVAWLCSILLLGLIVFGLHKTKFFQRKDKERLDNLKHEIRKASMKIKPPSDVPASDTVELDSSLDELDIEIIETGRENIGAEDVSLADERIVNDAEVISRVSVL